MINKQITKLQSKYVFLYRNSIQILFPSGCYITTLSLVFKAEFEPIKLSKLNLQLTCSISLKQHNPI